MDKILLGFESMTVAIKVRDILRRIEVDSKLIKVDGVSNGGCQYGISIDRADYFKSIAELSRRKVEYRVIE